MSFIEINTPLLLHAYNLITRWLPSGHFEYPDYVALNPTRADRRKGSFRINCKTGQWIDFATNDKGGDLISLYAYIHSLSQKEAVQILKQILNTQNFSKIKMHLPKVSKSPKVNADVVKNIWRQCLTAQNTIVEKYLNTRGCSGDIPLTIKYHPKLYHRPTESYYPAMVGAVQVWPESEIIGIHRTYLEHAGLSKALIKPNKMMLGKVNGGVVRLSPPGKMLVLAEGIETALSVYFSTGLQTWATLSTSGLMSVKLPPLDITQEIIIAADNDAAGLKAAHVLKDRLFKEGYTIRIALPDKGSDFNDMLKG
jgi:hypothetical protein